MSLKPTTGDSSAGDDSPLVSVVIPTYNRSGMLKRAVESVVAQTYSPIELVVVDDCSPTPATETLDAIDTDSLFALEVMRLPENRGVIGARNEGIEAATGDLVAFLDDDDWWLETKVEKQVAAFREGGETVGAVYTDCRFVGEDGETIRVHPVVLTHEDPTELILSGVPLAQFSAVMVRPSVLEQAGLPDENMITWEDREWYLRLSRHCSFATVSEPLTIRQTDHDDRVTADYEARRDIAYPTFLSKHSDLAAEQGWLAKRRWLASLASTVGKSALKNGYYGDARRYLLKSFVLYPLDTHVYPFLAVSLGGRTTYRLARRLSRKRSQVSSNRAATAGR